MAIEVYLVKTIVRHTCADRKHWYSTTTEGSILSWKEPRPSDWKFCPYCSEALPQELTKVAP